MLLYALRQIKLFSLGSAWDHSRHGCSSPRSAQTTGRKLWRVSVSCSVGVITHQRRCVHVYGDGLPHAHTCRLQLPPASERMRYGANRHHPRASSRPVAGADSHATASCHRRCHECRNHPARGRYADVSVLTRYSQYDHSRLTPILALVLCSLQAVRLHRFVL